MTYHYGRTNFFDNKKEYKDYLSELSRRSAMLDFLALYKMAAEEEIVGKIQFVNQAKGFSSYDPAGWEQYLTRLLGKCLRHHITETGAITKQRRNMIYEIDTNRTDLEDYEKFDRLFQMRYSWNRNNTLWEQADRNPSQYWKLTPLFEGHEKTFDALRSRWTVLKNAMEGLSQVGLSGWRGIQVRYGTPMHRTYYRNTYGRYQAAEAYRDFKAFLSIWWQFLEEEDSLRLLYLMKDFDHNNLDVRRSPHTVEKKKTIQVLRDKFSQRNRIGTVTTVTQDNTELRTRFMDKLREKGKVE